MWQGEARLRKVEAISKNLWAGGRVDRASSGRGPLVAAAGRFRLHGSGTIQAGLGSRRRSRSPMPITPKRMRSFAPNTLEGAARVVAKLEATVPIKLRREAMHQVY